MNQTVYIDFIILLTINSIKFSYLNFTKISMIEWFYPIIIGIIGVILKQIDKSKSFY